MVDPFVEERNGGYYVAGTRISLDSVVYRFRAGDSTDDIREQYDLLTLPQVCRAIALYLENRDLVDRSIEAKLEYVKANTVPLKEANPEMWARIEDARQTMRSKQS